jgi:hypothetical protein
MFPILGRQGRGLLLMTAALALAAAACSSSSGTASPAASASAAAIGPTATSQAGNSGDGSALGGAAANLANLTSYKYKMTLAGADFGQTLSLLGAADATGTAPFLVTGTIVTTPAKAADIHIASIHIVEIDGFDYIDMGLGGFVKTQMTDKGWADTVSPATMFASAIDPSSSGNFGKIGTENKNGVGADHYTASSGAFDQQASILGITGATWTGDVWIATSGGYPVSAAVIAKAADNTVAYEMTFELTNVNDPANSVAAPTNVVGA